MCLKRQGKECTWDFFKGIMIFLHYLNSIGEYILKHRNGTKAHILYKSVCLYVFDLLMIAMPSVLGQSHFF